MIKNNQHVHEFSKRKYITIFIFIISRKGTLFIDITSSNLYNKTNYRPKSQRATSIKNSTGLFLSSYRFVHYFLRIKKLSSFISL